VKSLISFIKLTFMLSVIFEVLDRSDLGLLITLNNKVSFVNII